MNDAERRKVETLFHQALALQEEEREAFLANACPDQPHVREEVSILLSDHARAAEFFANQNLSLDIVAVSQMPELPAGSWLRQYEIKRVLGRGGMGVVYLADDSILPRKVAIKILPPVYASDPELIARLQNEAKAASTLNHPNILTIYEFHVDENQNYIVSEYVEGTSLRSLIGTLSKSDCLNYAKQIGQALVAAHSAKPTIIHRDIKPENIMVRKDGLVKVLDFGLAKLGVATAEEACTETGTDEASQGTPALLTRVGTLMGTINYMSPEQARGDVVDHRTDIWSWGVVLYEMLKGQRPFEAVTVEELKSHHNKALIPVRRNRTLNRVLARALTTDVEQRYSSIEDALLDLPPEESRFVQQLRTILHSFVDFEGKKIPWKPWAVLVLVCGLVAWGGNHLRHRIFERSFRIVRVTSTTTTGNASAATISPDGGTIFYTTKDPGGEALRSINVKSNTSTELLPPDNLEYRGINVSPSGRLYFVTRHDEFGRLIRFTLASSEKQIVANDVDSAISLSADEKYAVFRRDDPVAATESLVVQDLTTGKERIVRALHSPDVFQPSLLWNIEGESVIYSAIVHDTASRLGSFRIEEVDAKSGNVVRSIEKAWRWIGMPVWVKPGRAFAAAVAEAGTNRPQIREIKWPSGADSPAWQDNEEYGDLAATHDARKLVSLQAGRRSWLWLAPLLNPENARSLGNSGRFFGVSWTANGQLISQTEINDRAGLWRIDPATNSQQLITSEPHEYQDAVTSPDGKYLVFASDRDGILHLWRSDPNGEHAQRLTDGLAREVWPSFSPDGRWVIFASYADGYSLWKVSIRGGHAVKILDHQAEKPAVSPDGKLVACEYMLDDLTWTIALFELESGRVRHTFGSIPTGTGALPVVWTHDGKSLIYAARDQNLVSNLWLQQINGGNPREITHFTDDSIFAFGLSPDGRTLAMIRGKDTSDVVLMTAN